MLHTWGQTLHHHPHLHCLVPAGGLALAGTAWVPCPKRFFLPVRVLSRLFRRTFLTALRQAATQERLERVGARPDLFAPTDGIVVVEVRERDRTMSTWRSSATARAAIRPSSR